MFYLWIWKNKPLAYHTWQSWGYLVDMDETGRPTGHPLLKCHALDPAKVLPPGSRRTTVAAHFPCLLGHGHRALVRSGQREQRAHVSGWREPRLPHSPAGGLAAHQGAGPRPSILRWHLWGGGGQKCPPGMGLLILVRLGLIHENQKARD